MRTFTSSLAWKRVFCLIAGALLATSMASASIAYTCDATIDATQAGTCAYLNGTVANLYNSTFSNVDASIYIQMGITGLGSSTTGFLNLEPYSTYTTALAGTASHDAVDTAAAANLSGTEPAIYSGGDIELTSALCTAVGIAGCTGTTSGGVACTIGTSGCYNGIITITTPANLTSEQPGQSLYWDQTGLPQTSDSYDFYSVVEHETDEVLGTSSCIGTPTALSDNCGGTNASAVDLFRYQGPGSLVFISTTPGAYFSYDGGATNGADGAAYNTLANGDDYADFATNCAHVQDATGCLGSALNITSDGNSEINILDAIGYNLNTVPNVPEPATWLLFGTGLAAIAAYRRKRSA